MKAATLLSLASTAFVLVSAAPSKALRRSPVPEPDPEPVPELVPEGNRVMSAGLECGLSGFPTVNIPDLATSQASNGFLGQLKSKTGSIVGDPGPTCTQVSCVNGVGVSFCNDELPAEVHLSTISTYAYDVSVACFSGGKTSNGRKSWIGYGGTTRWYVAVAGANCA